MQVQCNQYKGIQYICICNWRSRVLGTDNNHKELVHRGQMVIFEKDGEQIEVKASKDTKSPFDILLIGSSPINEPIARYGPFVMNTKEEVYQAIQDYRNGLMGSI